MKQVIIRIRDYKGRLISKNYYYSQAQYFENAFDFIKNQLLPGMEVQIKIGNQYSKFFTYEECQNEAEEYKYVYSDNEDLMYRTIDGVIYNNSIEDYSVKYYIKDYLPRY